MTEHICSTCGKKRPDCGNKREQKEGYCRKWVSSKTMSPETPVGTRSISPSSREDVTSSRGPNQVRDNSSFLTKETGEPK